MRFKTYILVLCFLKLDLFVMSQRTETAVNFNTEKSRLIFETENDMLFSSDSYYTAGTALSFTHKNIKKSPAQLIIKSKKAENYTYTGFGFQQRIFTPYNIDDPNSIKNDRPYSAYLLVTNFATIINPNKKIKISNEIGIGIMGEAAKGEEVQKSVHRIIGAITPIGWDNQLGSAFLIDYQLRIEKGFFNDWTASHFTPFASSRIGTLTNLVQAGLLTKWGNKGNYLVNASIPLELDNKLIWEWVFEINLQGVFYDATLEGGLFDNDPNAITKDETISRQYQLRTGVNLYYNKISLRYMIKFNSTDFNSAFIHRYASINIGFAF